MGQTQPGADSEREQLPEGTRVGRYTVVQRLGSGAMGIVYAAYDPDLDRRIALKLVRTGEGSTGGTNTRARLLREAKSNARLSHPNVVAVHDVGTYGADEVFIAMELVEGGTLRDVARRPSTTWRDKLALYLQAGEGLAAAHAAGLVHRDFKPDNVLIGADGRPRVCDFGLARLVHPDDAISLGTSDPGTSAAGRRTPVSAETVADSTRNPGHARPPAGPTSAMAETVPAPAPAPAPAVPAPAASGPSQDDASGQALAYTLTRSGALMGTPAYMAPEQLRGERADERADVFAFCVALYEALYGRRPFEGHTLYALSESIAAERVREPPAGSDVPRWVFDRLVRGLKRDPDARYLSMRELLDALRREPSASRRAWAVGAVAVLLAAAVAAGLAMQRSNPGAGSASGFTPPGGGSAAVALAPPGPRVAYEPSNFHRITFEDGCEEFPSFLPDGRAVVYDGAEGPDSSLFVLTLADLSKRRLTRTKGWDFAASVSPDGSHVAFLRSAPEQSGAFVLPMDATPETPAHFVVKGSLRPSWSLDGTAIWAGDHGHFTSHAVSDGHLVRSLDIATGYIGGQSIELADGRLVVTYPYIAEAAAGAVGVYARDGTFTKLLDGNVGEVLALLPGGASALVVRKLENVVPSPVAVPLDGSPAVSLAGAGILPGKGLAISPDGKKVVYSTCRGARNILRVPREGRPEPLSAAADWEDTDVAAIPGTSRLAVVSERSGSAQVWIVDRGGAPPRRLVTPDLDPADVAVSPDGKWAAASMTPKGIYLLAVDGSAPPRQLTSDPTDWEPAFDAAGENVLFTREGPDKLPQVMTVPVAGGAVKPRLERGSRGACVAADGRIVYLRGGSGDKELSILVLDPKRGGAARPLSPALPTGAYARPQLSPDGKKVALVRAGLEVVEVDAASGAVLRRFDHDADNFSRVAYSGDDLLVARALWAGDLWMADLR